MLWPGPCDAQIRNTGGEQNKRHILGLCGIMRTQRAGLGGVLCRGIASPGDRSGARFGSSG